MITIDREELRKQIEIARHFRERLVGRCAEAGEALRMHDALIGVLVDALDIHQRMVSGEVICARAVLEAEGGDL